MPDLHTIWAAFCAISGVIVALSVIVLLALVIAYRWGERDRRAAQTFARHAHAAGGRFGGIDWDAAFERELSGGER